METQLISMQVADAISMMMSAHMFYKNDPAISSPVPVIPVIERLGSGFQDPVPADEGPCRGIPVPPAPSHAQMAETELSDLCPPVGSPVFTSQEDSDLRLRAN